VKNITGSFLRPDGTPAAGATVNFLLSQNAGCSVGLLVHERVSVVLDENGALPSDLELWCNDELETAGTWYNVTLKDPVAGQVLYENVAIVGTSPISLPALTPLYTK
jgi:hypothetical protein